MTLRLVGVLPAVSALGSGGDAGGGSALANGLPAWAAAQQLMLAVTCWFSGPAAALPL